MSDVADDDLILDIGPETAKVLGTMLEGAGTVVWNGPVGVFEFEQFAAGTRALGEVIARHRHFPLQAAAILFGCDRRLRALPAMCCYISTGGGAFLEFIEGKTLPAVAMLKLAALNRSACNSA